MIRQVLVGSGRRAFAHWHPTSCLAFQDGAYASTSRVSCFAVPLAKEQMLRRGYATDVESQKRASADATQSAIDQKKGKEKTQASKQADGKQAAEANTDEEEQPPSFTTSSSQHFADENLKPLPLLSKPLGVPVAPSSKKLSWAERRELAFDYDRRMEKRKAIVKEATRGYFHDFHAMRSHGGKTWRAPGTLIRQDRSLFFPSIVGTSLADKLQKNTADILYGKVSVVCIITSQVSEQHVKSFYEPTLDAFQTNSDFQLVQINLQDNTLKAYLVSLFVSSLRKQVPANLQPTYLLSHQDISLEREAIRFDNKHVGYTYLVGPDGKIRWAGCGFAERQERQALAACTGVLLNRMAEQRNGSQ